MWLGEVVVESSDYALVVLGPWSPHLILFCVSLGVFILLVSGTSASSLDTPFKIIRLQRFKFEQRLHLVKITIISMDRLT